MLITEYTIANRYAKSFFAVLKRQKNLQQGYEDMQKILKIIREQPKFSDFLHAPIYPEAIKKKVIQEFLAGKVGKTTFDFLLLMVEKKRGKYLEAIALRFNELYDRQRNEGKAIMELAHPIFSSEIEVNLIAFIKKVTKWNNVKLSVKINPKLIGGYILTFKDRRIDASFQSKMDQLNYFWKKTLS